jgi:hypothetical protein
MKQYRRVSMALIVATLLVGLLIVLKNENAVANQVPLPPTPAPTATPGVPLPLPTSVPLARPLLSQEQALNQVLQYDASWAVWMHPWSKDTVSLEPDRITIETYPSIGAESVARGFKGEIPAVDADSGPIWVVTIKGDVHVAVITPYPDGASVIYDGVTYVISQRTGNLLEIRTGVPKNKIPSMDK